MTASRTKTWRRVAACITLTALAHGNVRAQQEWEALATTSTRTEVVLDSGSRMTLFGTFVARQRMWDGCALVWFGASPGNEGVRLWSLAAGESEPRPHLRVQGYDPLWSEDGTTLYFFRKQDELFSDKLYELVAMDAGDGRARVLHGFPMHYFQEFISHPDPAPLATRNGGLIEFGDLLLILTQEETNEVVAPWQRREDRIGGQQLVGVPRHGGEPFVLSGTRRLPGEASEGGWELGRRSRKLYIHSHHENQAELGVWTPGGERLGSIPLPAEGASGITLSPDERTLLIERFYRPGAPHPEPTVAWSSLRGEDLERAWAARDGGFVLRDVEEETVRDGPHGGWGAVWSPDGRWIAYLEDWELWLYSVESGVSFPVVRREPPPDRTTGPGWFAEPRWSHDGTKVAADPGAHGADDQRLILVNLATREFLVQDASRIFTWAPVPKPFRGE